MHTFLRKWLAPLTALAALSLAVFLYLYSPVQKHYRLRASAGNALGMRHQLAAILRPEMARRDLTLDLEPSAGSSEALDWVNSRKVDVALVQGGLTEAGRPNIRQVATLHIEPMHLLVKKELYRDVTDSLGALAGKTVDLEEAGSGTHALAVAVLDFVGLKPRDRDPVRGYVPLSLDRRQLFSQRPAQQLPDAIFLISSLPSSTSRYLITKHDYRLVPLPFAEALALESLASAASAEEKAPSPDQVVLGRIQSTSIPAFTYGVDPPVPDKPILTLGTRLLLVAHKDVAPKAAYRLVEGIYAAELARIITPPLEAKLMELPPEFPWHAGAVLYKERNSPLLSREVMDSAHKGFAIFAAAASGLFVLWQWLRQSTHLKRKAEFTRYLNQLRSIEEKTLAAEHGEPFASELCALRDELGALKTQALEEFANEEMAVKQLLLDFLAEVNDAREQVTRLMRRTGGAAKQWPDEARAL
jgi:TRAP-type uncharacterized transport system substrate-binding protein